MQSDRFIVVSTFERSFVFNACRCSLQAPLPVKSSGVGVVSVHRGGIGASLRIASTTRLNMILGFLLYFFVHRCSLSTASCICMLFITTTITTATEHSGAVSGRDLCVNNCYLSDECAMYEHMYVRFAYTHMHACVCVFARTSSQLSMSVPVRNAPGSLSLRSLLHSYILGMYIHTYV